MSSDARARASAGFTLVEVLVAISILAILASTIYGVFASVERAKDRLDADSEAYHRARVIFDRLGREIRGAYLSPGNSATRFEAGETVEGAPFIELSTTAVSLLSQGGTGFALVRYTLVQDPETDDGSRVLLRNEWPLQAKGQQPATSGAMRLAPGIAALGLRFFGGDAWQDEWDASRSGLPALVEVTLTMLDADGNRQPFRTAFDLPRRRLTR